MPAVVQEGRFLQVSAALSQLQDGVQIAEEHNDVQLDWKRVSCAIYPMETFNRIWN